MQASVHVNVTVWYMYMCMCTCTVRSDLSRLLWEWGLQALYVYQLSPYFPKFMLFYVTWPSIQQGLQIDNNYTGKLFVCSHTVSPLYSGPQYILLAITLTVCLL